MSLSLTHTQMNLGLTEEMDRALNVDLIPVALPVITTSMGIQLQAAFCDIDSDDKHQRLIGLLKPLIDKQLADNTIDFTKTPVYWLLPELAIDNNQPLIELANLLKIHFPELFNHEKTQFFPFGSSAIVMALKTAQGVLNDQYHSQNVSQNQPVSAKPTTNDSIEYVCFIAVDSFYHDLQTLLSDNVCLTACHHDGLIPSEGAVMTCVSLADQGINVITSHSDRATKHQVAQSIESLFYTVAQQLKRSQQDNMISQLYTPSNGLSKYTTPWMEAYQRLAGHVNQDTKLKQLRLLTGDLGCVTGLYHFLHIYHAYQHQSITGNTLQLEMSARLYQAVNLYSWTGKDAR